MCRDESQPISEELLDSEVVVCNALFVENDISNFPNLRMIQLTSAGLDRVPLNEINDRGIILTNARGIYSIPIAEWVMLKILEIYKQTRYFESAQKNCKWQKNRDILELKGKTIGVVGTGSIGIEIAKRAKAFGSTVIGINTKGTDVEYFDKCFSTKYLNLLLKQSDVVVLSLPLTKKTFNLIDQNSLNVMRDDAVLINVSRGGIINEDDLVKHLETGKLRGVALDVFDEEPLPVDSPLWKHPRVLVTPHNSFVSERVPERMFELIYTNLKLFAEAKPVKNRIQIQ